MARNMRDDFLEKTKRRLMLRVAHTCSNPECRVQVIGPGKGADGVINVAVAAHIHAASPGGPRYRADMKPAERRGITNAICLCAVCAKKVDDDPDAYTDSMLRVWKANAEARAAEGLNRAFPSRDDGRREMVATLSGSADRFLPHLISNAHQAASGALEGLDPRLVVRTSFDGTTPTYVLHARSVPVPLKIKVDPSLAAEWQDSLRRMLEHGTAASVEGTGVRIDGSPLIDALTRECATGKVTMQRDAIAATFKCTVIPDVGDRIRLDDAAGVIRVGSKGMTCSASVFGGLLILEFHAEASFATERPADGTLTIATNFETWVGKTLAQLPFFMKVSELIPALAAEAVVDFVIEVQGSRLVHAQVRFADDVARLMNEALALLEYTRLARLVAERLDLTLRFSLEQPVTCDQQVALARAAHMLKELATFERCALRSNPRGRLRINADRAALNRLLAADDLERRLVELHLTAERLIVFGQVVEMPAFQMILDGVNVRLLQTVDAAQEGDEIEVEFEPLEDFKGSFRLGPGDAVVDRSSCD